MRCVLEGLDLFPFELGVAGDEIFGEDVALLEEGIVGGQR